MIVVVNSVQRKNMSKYISSLRDCRFLQELRGMQVRTARFLLRVAADVFGRKKGWAPVVLALAG